MTEAQDMIKLLWQISQNDTDWSVTGFSWHREGGWCNTHQALAWRAACCSKACKQSPGSLVPSCLALAPAVKTFLLHLSSPWPSQRCCHVNERCCRRKTGRTLSYATFQHPPIWTSTPYTLLKHIHYKKKELWSEKDDYLEEKFIK